MQDDGGSREQRLVFGEDATLYDRARPGYADEVVDAVLAYASVAPASCRAVEIGAGTGKATTAFARRGVRVVALEPDPAMAAVAAHNLEPWPAVQVEVTGFEDWELTAGTCDLVFSAQAWHWVRADVRCAKAARALRDRGALALMWHRIAWAEGDPVRAALDDCYSRNAPDLRDRHPGFPGLGRENWDEAARAEVAQSGFFDDVVVHQHRWEGRFSTTAFLDLLRTQSDHRMLRTEDREHLLGAVGDVVRAYGGAVSIPYETFVVLGRRRPASDAG